MMEHQTEKSNPGWVRDAPDRDLLQGPVLGDCEPALKRLGPLPFPRGSFPLMGFFATVYEHIASHAQNQLDQTR